MDTYIMKKDADDKFPNNVTINFTAALSQALDKIYLMLQSGIKSDKKVFEILRESIKNNTIRHKNE